MNMFKDLIFEHNAQHCLKSKKIGKCDGDNLPGLGTLAHFDGR